MPEIRAEEVIAADRVDLYKLAQDYRHRLEWDSFAGRIRYDNGVVTTLVGLVSAPNLINPFNMTVEHFSVVSPSLVATNMLHGPFVFSSLTGSWRFDALENGTTRVVLESRFRLRWPFLGFVLDPILTKIISHNLYRFLFDLKHAAEYTDIIGRIGDRSP